MGIKSDIQSLKSVDVRLESEIRAIPKVDEQSLINKAVKGAESLLKPEIVLFGTVATTALGRADLATELGQAAKSYADDAARLGRQALDGLGALSNRVSNVATTAGNALNTAKNAAGTAASAAGTAASAIAQIAGVAASLLALAATVATLLILGSRIDAVENYVDSVASDLSKAFGLIGGVKNIAVNAQSSADTANREAQFASSKAAIGIANAGRAQDTANYAAGEADKANSRIPLLQSQVTNLSREIDGVSGRVTPLERDVPLLKASVGGLSQDIDGVSGRVAPLERDVPLLKASVGGLSQEIDSVRGRVAPLERDVPLLKASVGGLSQEIDSVRGRVAPLERDLPTVRDIANNAQRTADATGIRAKVAQATADAANTKSDNATNLANTANSTASGAALTAAGAIAIANAALAKANAPGTTINVSDTAAIAGLNSRVGTLEGKIKEQDKMNQQGLAGIGALTALVQQMPATISNSAAFRSAATSAAAAGVCSTTRPGGCLGNQFQNQNNKLDDLLRKADLGLQAGQGALLNTINNGVNLLNTKVGSLPLTGGLSGAFSRFTSWAAIDRVTNLVTMAAAVHNAVQLSSGITETFFEILDDLFAIPSLIKNPDGETIDTKQAFTTTVDAFFKNLFGVTEWAAIKKEWAAYSRIYSSASQVINNVREIGSNIQDTQQVTNRWMGELGNGLQDEGLIGEDNWDYKDKDATTKGKFFRRMQAIADGIEQASEGLESIQQVTSNLREITETANQIKTDATEIEKAVNDATKVAKERRATEVEGLQLPAFSLTDFLPGD